MRIISLFLPLIALMQAPLFALNTFDCKPGDKLHVLATSGLRLRNAPQAGEVIVTIPYGATVSFLVQSGEFQTNDSVENMAGNWVQVGYNGNEGWVFDAFLSYLPAPSANCTSLRAYLKEAFKPVGAPVVREKSISDGILTKDSLQMYVYNGFTAIFTTDGGYESYSEHVAFYQVSVEEVWLISRICYKKEIAGAASRLDRLMKKSPLTDCSLELSESIDPKRYKTFMWDGQDSNDITLDMLACECYEEMVISACGHVILFSFGNGC